MGSLENESPAALYAWDMGEVLLLKVVTERGREIVKDLSLAAAGPEETLHRKFICACVSWTRHP